MAEMTEEAARDLAAALGGDDAALLRWGLRLLEAGGEVQISAGPEVTLRTQLRELLWIQQQRQTQRRYAEILGVYVELMEVLVAAGHEAATSTEIADRLRAGAQAARAPLDCRCDGCGRGVRVALEEGDEAGPVWLGRAHARAGLALCPEGGLDDPAPWLCAACRAETPPREKGTPAPAPAGRPAPGREEALAAKRRAPDAHDQPAPTGDGPEVLPVLLARVGVERVRGRIDHADQIEAHLRGRAALGRERYGTPLRAHNGRDAWRDLREELLDGAMYATQARVETPEHSPRHRAAAQIQHLLLQALDALFEAEAREADQGEVGP